MVECNVSEKRLNFVLEVCIFKRGCLLFYFFYKSFEKYFVIGIWLEWFVKKDFFIIVFIIFWFIV